MVNSIYQLVTVRLYENPHFAKKMGPAQTNPYVFNASIEFPNGAPRMFADLTTFKNLALGIDPSDYAHLHPSIIQAATSNLGYAPVHEEHFVGGQLFELNPKAYSYGAVVMSMLDWRGLIFLSTDRNDLDLFELLRFRFCRNTETRGRAPTYLGTNHTLQRSAPVAPAANSMAKDASAILEKIRSGTA